MAGGPRRAAPEEAVAFFSCLPEEEEGADNGAPAGRAAGAAGGRGPAAPGEPPPLPQAERLVRRLRKAESQLQQAQEQCKQRPADDAESSSTVVSLRLQLRRIYAELLVRFPAEAHKWEADVRLWRTVFASQIERHRGALRQARQGGAEGGAAEGELAAYLEYLREAAEYYEGVARELAKRIPGAPDPVALQRLLHAAHVRLGDLARYGELARGGAGDWAAARAHYSKAVHAFPGGGWAHNQLGLLAELEHSDIEAVYRYCRALSCAEPFQKSLHNLSVLFERCRRDDPVPRRNSHESGGDADAEARQFARLFARVHGALFALRSTPSPPEGLAAAGAAACAALATMVRADTRTSAVLLMHAAAVNIHAVGALGRRGPCAGALDAAADFAVSCFAATCSAGAGAAAAGLYLRWLLACPAGRAAVCRERGGSGLAAAVDSFHKELRSAARGVDPAAAAARVQLPEDAELQWLGIQQGGPRGRSSTASPAEVAAARLHALEAFRHAAAGWAGGSWGQACGAAAPPADRAPRLLRASRPRGSHHDLRELPGRPPRSPEPSAPAPPATLGGGLSAADRLRRRWLISDDDDDDDDAGGAVGASPGPAGAGGTGAAAAVGGTPEDAALPTAPSAPPLYSEYSESPDGGGPAGAAHPGREEVRIPLPDLGDRPQWRVLGRGGFGTVYATVYATMMCEVAVKKLSAPRSGLLDERKRRKFVEEIRRLEAFRFNKILNFYGWCLDDQGGLYMVTELCEGNFAEIVRRRRVDQREALSVAEDVAQAVYFIHTRHACAHLDIAARNVFAARDCAKLGDFGLCAAIGDPAPVMPTLWTPPETLRCPAAERRATVGRDVWGYGVLLWELLSGGAVPYEYLRDESQSRAEFYRAVVHSVMEGVTLRRPGGCSDAVWSRLAVPCFAQDPGARCQSFSELVLAVRALRSDAPAAPDTAPAAWPSAAAPEELRAAVAAVRYSEGNDGSIAYAGSVYAGATGGGAAGAAAVDSMHTALADAGEVPDEIAVVASARKVLQGLMMADEGRAVTMRELREAVEDKMGLARGALAGARALLRETVRRCVAEAAAATAAAASPSPPSPRSSSDFERRLHSHSQGSIAASDPGEPFCFPLDPPRSPAVALHIPPQEAARRIVLGQVRDLLRHAGARPPADLEQMPIEQLRELKETLRARRSQQPPPHLRAPAAPTPPQHMPVPRPDQPFSGTYAVPTAAPHQEVPMYHISPADMSCSESGYAAGSECRYADYGQPAAPCGMPVPMPYPGPMPVAQPLAHGPWQANGCVYR
eukprot:TRINITY_DN13944_c0_g2_i1.p1 TRINITY_DN13944_c0_g2~~TRINITY_DN13944_c0_g2_i1.p1  ORF type:complete len:1286 (+),score=328.14 TRINITY_DN13944_c0_g2_i1:95-3952(+)